MLYSLKNHRPVVVANMSYNGYIVGSIYPQMGAFVLPEGCNNLLHARPGAEATCRPATEDEARAADIAITSAVSLVGGYTIQQRGRWWHVLDADGQRMNTKALRSQAKAVALKQRLELG